MSFLSDLMSQFRMTQIPLNPSPNMVKLKEGESLNVGGYTVADNPIQTFDADPSAIQSYLDTQKKEQVGGDSTLGKTPISNFSDVLRTFPSNAGGDSTLGTAPVEQGYVEADGQFGPISPYDNYMTQFNDPVPADPNMAVPNQTVPDQIVTENAVPEPLVPPPAGATREEYEKYMEQFADPLNPNGTELTDGLRPPPDMENMPVETAPSASTRPQPRPSDIPLMDDVDDGTPEESKVPAEVQKEADDIIKNPTADVTRGSGVTSEQVKEIAEKDPVGFQKAMNWVTENIGVTGKDLAKFAFLYAGSRLAGYKHSESMTFGFDEAMGDVRARQAFAQQLTDSGKYTAESIQEFSKTGKRDKLKLTTSPNATKTNWTNVKIGEKGQKLVEQTDSSGNKYYVHLDDPTKRYAGPVTDPKDPMGMNDLMKEWQPTAARTITTTVDNMTDGMSDSQRARIVINQESDASAALTMIYDAFGADADTSSPEYTTLIDNATRDAIEWSKKTGKQVNSILPFLEQQLIYTSAGSGWATELGTKSGDRLGPTEWKAVKDAVMNPSVMNDPEVQAAIENSGFAAVTDAIFNGIWMEWNALSAEEKKKYKHGSFSPFYNYARESMNQ